MLHQAHNLGAAQSSRLIIRQAMFGLASARSAPAGWQERASCGLHLPLNDDGKRERERRGGTGLGLAISKRLERSLWANRRHRRGPQQQNHIAWLVLR
jgi:hypothetical protein